MKRLLLTAIIFVLGVIAPISKSNANSLTNIDEIKIDQNSNGATKSASSWEEFTPEEFKFSILFPTENPAETSKLDDETLLLNLRGSTVGQSVYALGYGKFKIDVSQVEVDTILEAYVSGRITKSMKLVAKKEINLEGYSGKEYQTLDVDGTISIGRVYLVGQNLYIVEVINSQNLDAEKFLNSFKLVK